MRWSLKLASVAGIGVYMHWTFPLLIAWLAWMNWDAGLRAVALVVGFVLALFLCVVLHEFGHALTAKRFGIRTRDITLLPIGGVARLERMPHEPRQELLIAIAGPAVNVVIAALIFGTLWVLPSTPGSAEVLSASASPGRAHPLLDPILQLGFWRYLGALNVFLVLFNMLPAFPMDGGRVLRAALAYRMDYPRATRVAAGVGQVMAGLFFFLGLLSNPFLLLIAVFVFLGAQAEAQMAEVRWNIEDVPVRDAMITEFAALRESDTLDDASRLLLAGSQQDFPVMDGERIAGVLARSDLLRALASKGAEVTVGEVMRRDCRPVDDSAPLTQVFDRMQQGACPLLPVTRRGQLVGLLTLENVGEFIMIRAALRGVRGTAAPGYPRRVAPNAG